MTLTAGRVHWWKITTRETHLNQFMGKWLLILIRSTLRCIHNISWLTSFCAFQPSANWSSRVVSGAFQDWNLYKLRFAAATLWCMQEISKTEIEKGGAWRAPRAELITWMNERHCRVNEFSFHQPFPTKERAASCPPEVLSWNCASAFISFFYHSATSFTSALINWEGLINEISVDTSQHIACIEQRTSWDPFATMQLFVKSYKMNRNAWHQPLPPSSNRLAMPTEGNKFPASQLIFPRFRVTSI